MKFLCRLVMWISKKEKRWWFDLDCSWFEWMYLLNSEIGEVLRLLWSFWLLIFFRWTINLFLMKLSLVYLKFKRYLLPEIMSGIFLFSSFPWLSSFTNRKDGLWREITYSIFDRIKWSLQKTWITITHIYNSCQLFLFLPHKKL